MRMAVAAFSAKSRSVRGSESPSAPEGGGRSDSETWGELGGRREEMRVVRMEEERRACATLGCLAEEERVAGPVSSGAAGAFVAPAVVGEEATGAMAVAVLVVTADAFEDDEEGEGESKALGS